VQTAAKMIAGGDKDMEMAVELLLEDSDDDDVATSFLQGSTCQSC